MEYARLGNSGLKISKVVLGCMSYGSSAWSEWVLDEEHSLPLLKAAFDNGITTWDTADTYSNGESEKIVGKAIKKYNIPRERLVILTKCFGCVAENVAERNIYALRDPEWVNRVGLSRKHIFDAVDQSVARLGTYIDVLQIHRLDRGVPMEEIMKALHDVVQSGKVRYIGASSTHAWEFQMLQNIAEKNTWTKFISMQNWHNLLYREEEREMIPYCKATGVGLIPWSPVARGVLCRPQTAQPTLRHETDEWLAHLSLRDAESDKVIIGRVEELAKKHETTMAIIAISWTLHKGDMPIVGLNSVKRIEEAVQAVKFKLSEEEIKYLEEPYVPRNVMAIEF